MNELYFGYMLYKHQTLLTSNKKYNIWVFHGHNYNTDIHICNNNAYYCYLKSKQIANTSCISLY